MVPEFPAVENRGFWRDVTSMAGRINTWEEYAAALEKQLLNSVNSEGFMHSQVVKPDGSSVTFRSADDIRAQLNLANTMVARSRVNGSFFFGECAP